MVQYDPENVLVLVAHYKEALYSCGGGLSQAIDALNKVGSKREPGKRFWLLWGGSDGLILYEERKDLFPLELGRQAYITWLVTGDDLVCTKHRVSLHLDMFTLTAQNSAKIDLNDLKAKYA